MITTKTPYQEQPTIKMPSDICPYQYLRICKKHKNQGRNCSLLQQAERARERSGNKRDFDSYKKAYQKAQRTIFLESIKNKNLGLLTIIEWIPELGTSARAV